MKFSIITINFNNAEGLQKTIESVISQTFIEFEFIVIDGASVDGSVDIIKKYADKFTYWVSEPDKGIYNAMNKGILQAQGEYCLFLNSGDWLVAPTVLHDVFANQELDADIDLIIGRLHRRHNSNKGIIRKKENELIRFSDFFSASLPHPATFIRKKLFTLWGLYNENHKIVSDWEFFMSVIIQHNAAYKFINVEVSDVQPQGISSTANNLHMQERKEYLTANYSVFMEDYDEYFFYKTSRTIQRIRCLIKNLKTFHL